MRPRPCPGNAIELEIEIEPRRLGAAAFVALLALVPLCSGCRQQVVPPKPEASAAALRQGELQGHAATVRCLRGERSLTDGDELRCEAWVYVKSNYSAAAPASPSH